MDNPAEIVRKTYNKIASRFYEWAKTVRIEERKKYVRKIKSLISNGSVILDIGCGNGLLNTVYLTQDYTVIGIDISEKQINEAKKNVPDARFICSDVRLHDFQAESFDGIISFYCFNHIPRDTYQSMLKKIHTWLKPKGLLIATFGIGDTEGWIGEWLAACRTFRLGKNS
jgi:cyclopropane fatty-acyl-phospholipid synthase-like methyltransferase